MNSALMEFQMTYNANLTLNVFLFLVENTEHFFLSESMYIADMNWVNITTYSQDLRVATPNRTIIRISQSVDI